MVRVSFESLEFLGDDNYWLRIRIPHELDRYVVYKGSIAIDGISLTVAAIENRNRLGHHHSAHLRDDRVERAQARRSREPGVRHVREISGERWSQGYKVGA